MHLVPKLERSFTATENGFYTISTFQLEPIFDQMMASADPTVVSVR